MRVKRGGLVEAFVHDLGDESFGFCVFGARGDLADVFREEVGEQFELCAAPLG